MGHHPCSGMMNVTNMQRRKRRFAQKRRNCYSDNFATGGQNVFDAGDGKVAHIDDAVEKWHSEVEYHNFEEPGVEERARHFTQLVWVQSEYVGVALSDDGRFIVATYHPCGNIQQKFKRNVSRRGVPMMHRLLMGTISGEEWSEKFDEGLIECPCKEEAEKAVRDAFNANLMVTLTREEKSISITIRNSKGWSQTGRATWN